jgi:hypothetical protein
MKLFKGRNELQMTEGKTCTVAVIESTEEFDRSCNFAETSGTKSSNLVEVLQNLRA